MSREMVAIEPDLIDVSDRLRDVDETSISRVLVSFRTVGQITPIEVLVKADGRYKLIAGRHRVQAAIELGWDTIDAVIFDGTLDEARLREVDENLARVELSAYDQSNFLALRRQIWEKMNGEITRGGDRKSKGHRVPSTEPIKKNSSFFKETAKALGIDERTVKRALTRKSQILPALWGELKGSAEAKNGALLDRLRKETFETQGEVLTLAKKPGGTVEYSLSLLRVRVQQKPENVVQTVKKIASLWSAWSAAERATFRKEMRKLK